MRTAVASNVIEIARRILENAHAGRVYANDSIEWAKSITSANAPSDVYRPVHGGFPDSHQSRAPGHFGESA